jgi:hypothetical protein
MVGVTGYAPTVPFQSIRQSRVTKLSVLTKCHICPRSQAILTNLLHEKACKNVPKLAKYGQIFRFFAHVTPISGPRRTQNFVAAVTRHTA